MSKPATKFRFVYCPKCQQLLTEFADIPVYKCGGCGAVLRAKDRGHGVASCASKTQEVISVDMNAAGLEFDISDTLDKHNFVINNALEKHPVDRKEHGRSSEDSESVASSKQVVLCSDMNCEMELAESVDYDDNLSDHRRNLNAICPIHKLHSHRTKDSPAASQNEEESNRNGRRDSNSKSLQQDNQFTIRERDLAFTAQKQPTQTIQSRTKDSKLNEKSQNVGHYISNHIRSNDKFEETIGSSDNNIVSEGDVTDTNIVGMGHDFSKYETNRMSEAYDGSVSSNGDSYDNSILHGQTQLHVRTSLKPESIPASSSNNTSTYPVVQSQARNVSLMPPNENYGLDPAQSINLSRNEHQVKARYGFESHKRANLQEYDIFNSVWNWMESEKEDPYRSQQCEARYRDNPLKVYYYKTGSPSNYGHEDLGCSPNSYRSDKFGYLEQDRLMLLRKVDELRERLSKAYCEREEASENFPIKGSQQERHWPLRHCIDSRNQLQHYIDHSYHPRKTGPQQCRPSQIPFSGLAKNYRHHVDKSCIHCHPQDHQFPAQFPPCICFNKGLCGACPGHIFYHSHSPGPASSQLLTENSRLQEQRNMDRDIDELQCREKCRPIKRHFLRAIAGGAPFVICYSCRKLLQMPADFLLSRRRCHKLQCGACSRVLTFWFHYKTHVLSYNRASQVWNPSNEVHNNSDTAVRNLPFPSEGDPVSCSDDCGLSLCKSNPTEGETSLLAPRIPMSQSSGLDERDASNGSPQLMDQNKKKVSEFSGPNSQNSRLPRSVIPSPVASKFVRSPLDVNMAAPVGASPLHQLMGYSSPGEMINGSKTGDSKSKDRDIQTEANFYAASRDNAMSSPVRGHLELKSFVFHNAISKEDVLSEGVGNTKDQSIPEIISKAPGDFDHELENEKLKVSVNGRLIPNQLIKKAEELAGPIGPGNYWYDSRAGFWGVMGQPCLGIIPPFIEEFNYPMMKDCAGGNTGILVNGRELHHEDLDLLSYKGLPTTKNKAYIVKSRGQVIDEELGKELDSLGKLAPTVEKLGQGFGMHVPDW